MESEIEFRGKLINNGDWAYGNLHISASGIAIITPDKSLIGRYGQVDTDTVGQYTRMIDKNKKKIYEGDIIKAWSDGVCAIGYVKRRTDGLYVMYPAYQYKEFWGLCPNKNGETSVEIMGNIFDNPDLIKLAEPQEQEE